MKSKPTIVKNGSTLILRLAVLAFAAIIFALCVFGLPAAIASDNTGYYRPILFGMYVPAIPFFIAIYQTLKLLGYIDKNKAFSKLSVKALEIIKYCAVAIGALYMAGSPYIFYAADRDDAPGVFAIGLVIIFASFAVAVFAAVLQKLLQKAIDIKTENDLTV